MIQRAETIAISANSAKYMNSINSSMTLKMSISFGVELRMNSEANGDISDNTRRSHYATLTTFPMIHLEWAFVSSGWPCCRVGM